MTSKNEPKQPPGDGLSKLRRRRFLGLFAGGIAGGLAAARSSLGAAFMPALGGADPRAARCSQTVIGSTTCTGVVTTPSTTFSTTQPAPPGATGSTMTTGQSWVTGVTGVPSTTTVNGRTIPYTETNRYTEVYTATFSYTWSGGTLTVTMTNPSASVTVTWHKSWIYTMPCTFAPAPVNGQFAVRGTPEDGRRILEALELANGPSTLRGNDFVSVQHLGV